MPGYHSFIEDQKAVVELYVKKKNHPNTIGKVNGIVKISIPKAENTRDDADREINRLEGAIANWELNIQNGTNALQQKNLKDGYEKNLNDYRAELSDARTELTKIDAELATYHNYCQLVRKILVNFQLHGILPSKDDKLADEFIFNFPVTKN